MKPVKLTAGQLKSLINEEVNRLDEAPKRGAKKPTRRPTARANVQGALNDVVTYLCNALFDRHGDILNQEVSGIMKEMVQNGSLSIRELNHMSPAYLQRLDISQALKKHFVPELADIIADSASELRHYDPSADE